MPGPATRSRGIELRRSRVAARQGRGLLDEKREALLREVQGRRGTVAAKRLRAGRALADARALLAEAEVELGLPAVDAAALAQRAELRVELSPRRVAGVAAWNARLVREPFRIQYGPGGTAASLDRAAAAFADAIPALVELAAEEGLLAGLETALAKTNRRLNALEEVILPGLDADIRAIESSLEEEERDEAVRTRSRRAAVRAGS